jgi:hydrogenase expression/formation protein HypE
VKKRGIDISGLSCPIPLTDYPSVLLAHGGGGKLTQQLIHKMFRASFGNPHLDPLHDGATLGLDGARLAFTTDSYVVNPLFFPGGNIGSLAVHGTVNDLSMCGARPLYLSAGFIMEEGLPMDDLWRIVLAMQEAAAESGVTIVTGDTKVVDKGKGDGLFINTAGIGSLEPDISIQPGQARPGDAILLNGPIADHGIAIMSVREGLEFETTVESDSAPLNGLVGEMLMACKTIRVLRDPTRGGIASALNEIADQSEVGMELREDRIPLREEVKGACELLGLDPLYVANEGKVLAIVPAGEADRVLEAMKKHPLGKDATVIGEVTADRPGVVTMKSTIGGTRVVDMLSGEQLPRIC